MRTLDAALVLTLMLIATLVVLVGLVRRRNMWRWIIAYWAVLTVRNAVALLMGLTR